MEQAVAEQGVKELSDLSADLRRLKQAAKLCDQLSPESKQWLVNRLRANLVTQIPSCGSAEKP
jgi:hypothetical protein